MLFRIARKSLQQYALSTSITSLSIALAGALTSPAGVAAGQKLVQLAGSSATLLFAEHMEDVPAAPTPNAE